jgi:hypothetical protein
MIRPHVHRHLSVMDCFSQWQERRQQHQALPKAQRKTAILPRKIQRR